MGPLIGTNSIPFMRLEYGASLRRPVATYSGIGSLSSQFTDLPGVLPCDLAPMTDSLVFAQAGQQSTLTHIIHFQPGTDVRDRDECVIVYAPQPGNYGNVGDTYIILSVIQPSETIAYIRCRAFKAKVPSS
jgi:hypothetical protein